MKYQNLLFFVLLFTLGCVQQNPSKDDGSLKIVCTTGMIGDAVKNIIGNDAEIITLMGPGVDPHLYKATQGDLKHLLNADVIIYNGLHLEGKMGEIFEKLSNRKHIIVASGGLEEKQLINNTDFQGAHDPHIWFDVSLWSEAVNYMAGKLIELDSSNSKIWKENKEHYILSLQQLDKEVKINIESIPKNNRVLITAHDAFGYFGKAYNIEVKGLQGISTASEYGLKDVSDLVAFIVSRKIKAVFVESSVSDRSLNAVVQGCKSSGHEVKIGGTLFSDAMGESNTLEGTYIGMVKHNVDLIVNGLK